MKQHSYYNLKSDLFAGLVVFLIAIPLCLGIALASGAPLYSGIVSGMVGGIVIGLLSKSPLSVSGPAAGLTAVIALAITDLGSFEVFLCAVILAGAMQFLFGVFRAGFVSSYFPSNVIEGMLAAIGLIIIMKQVPYLLGFDLEKATEFMLLESGFSSIHHSLKHISPGILLIGLISLALLIFWERPFMKKFQAIPAALIVVIFGALMNILFSSFFPFLAIDNPNYMVNLPIAGNIKEFVTQFTLPDFAGFSNPNVWQTALVIALIASIESLLSVEAIDKLDPYKRYTPSSRELKAQGIGNIVSGFLGGLPVTSVIVRSSANLNAGGRTKIAAITHGALLILCVALVPSLLNKIPLAALAAVLIMVGYKLCKPSVFVHMWKDGGYVQFIPFIITLISVVFLDLLKGVAIGMVVSVFFMLRQNMKIPYYYKRITYSNGEVIHLTLSQEVSFLNKASIKETLDNIPEGTNIIIDANQAAYIDFDVLDLLREFKEFRAPTKNIKVSFIGFKNIYNIENASEVIPVELLSNNEQPKRSSGRYETLIRQLKRDKFSK